VPAARADEYTTDDVDTRAVQWFRLSGDNCFSRIDDIATVFAVETKLFDMECVENLLRF